VIKSECGDITRMLMEIILKPKKELEKGEHVPGGGTRKYQDLLTYEYFLEDLGLQSKTYVRKLLVEDPPITK
jgi:hypothetical protein